MEVLYKNKKVEKLCTNYSNAVKNLGQDVATKLDKAINALFAAVNLKDIRQAVWFRLHALSGNRKGTFAIDLGKTTGFRLIILPLDKDKNVVKANDMSIYVETVCVEIEEVSNHYE